MAQDTYNCEKCGTEIPLWPGSQGVFCQHCGAEQHWAPGPDGEQTTEPSLGQPASDRQAHDAEPLLPIPDGLEVSDDGRALTMRRRWFTPAILFLVFFCIAWDSFLVFWYSMAFGDDNVPWLMIVFPVAHVAVGVGLTYLTIATIFNTTTVRVERRRLSVSHGPIPWVGNHRLDLSAIEQLYCEESRSTSTSKHGHTTTTITFDVKVVLKSRKKVTLVSGLKTVNEARFFERTIEGYLGIQDQRVAGEV